MSKLSISVAVGLLGTSLLLSGCASERVKAEMKKQKENKDGYVWVYPTGSNIPVLVPKDQANAKGKTTEADQKALEDAQRLKQRPNSGPGAQ